MIGTKKEAPKGFFAALLLVARGFLDLRSLADLVAEVVQLGTTDLTAAGNLDMVNLRGMYREGALNANVEADLADREGLARGSALTANHDALEHLDALTVTFGDAVVHAHGVADVEIGDIVLNLLLFNRADVIHCRFLLFPVPFESCLDAK